MSADQTPHSVNRVIFVLYCRFSGFILANPNVSNDAAAATSTIHCHEKSLTKYTHCYDDRHTYTKYNCRCSCVLLVLSSEWSVHECKYSSFRAATWRRSFDQNCDSHLAGRWMDMTLQFRIFKPFSTCMSNCSARNCQIVWHDHVVPNRLTVRKQRSTCREKCSFIWWYLIHVSTPKMDFCTQRCSTVCNVKQFRIEKRAVAPILTTEQHEAHAVWHCWTFLNMCTATAHNLRYQNTTVSMAAASLWGSICV
jgi:hypothetical protein